MEQQEALDWVVIRFQICIFDILNTAAFPNDEGRRVL